MPEVNTGKKMSAILTGGKEHLSAKDIAEVMLSLREDFDWVSTTCGRILLNEQPNDPREIGALINNTKMLLTAMDTPLLQQLYRRVLERAASDFVSHARNDSTFFNTEAGQRLWQDLSGKTILAYQAGYFSGRHYKPYLASITDKMAEAANLFRNEGMLTLAASIRCFDDMALISAYLAERKQWQD